MQQRFQDKVAVVTGAGSGIGRATATALAREGAYVVVADRVEPQGEETCRTIKQAGGRTEFAAVNVTRPKDVAAVFSSILGSQRRIDLAVNSAGVLGVPSDVAQVSEASWTRLIDVNLNGVWRCMTHELTQMAAQGGGAIVNVSSASGTIGFTQHAAYSASKHGVLGLTKTAALEYAQRGVRVNAVCPGIVRTPMTQRTLALGADAEDQMKASVPMRRIAEVEEVTAAILWLASAEASYITGHGLMIDGGMSVQ